MTSQELINIGALLMQSQHNQVDQSLKKTIPQRKILETDESSRIFIQDMLMTSSKLIEFFNYNDQQIKEKEIWSHITNNK